MIRSTRLSALLLSVLLTACGGGSGDPVVPDSDDGADDSDTGGLIDQDSFDIAVSTFNPGAVGKNGVAVDISVYAGDRLQNPVPDGTVIYFNAESGIIPASCETTDGGCEVTWTSSGYRPGQENQQGFADLERVNETNVNANRSAYGLTSILAYAVGEAGFSDSNDNGLYDIGESFEAFGEPYRDDNAMNVYLLDTAPVLDTNSNGKPVEFFADYNQNGMWDDAPDKYQGSRCTEAARNEGHCASLMFVSQLIVISQSSITSNNIYAYTYSSESGFQKITTLDSSSGTLYLLFTDGNGAIPSSGTTFSITGNGYDVGEMQTAPSNNIGLLLRSSLYDEGLDSSFGSLFEVTYKANGSPESIVITATAEDGTLETKTLTP